jgi:hypothetical protein
VLGQNDIAHAKSRQAVGLGQCAGNQQIGMVGHPVGDRIAGEADEGLVQQEAGVGKVLRDLRKQRIGGKRFSHSSSLMPSNVPPPFSSFDVMGYHLYALDILFTKIPLRMRQGFSAVSLPAFPGTVDDDKNLPGAALRHSQGSAPPGTEYRGDGESFRHTSDRRRSRQPPYHVCISLSYLSLPLVLPRPIDRGRHLPRTVS